MKFSAESGQMKPPDRITSYRDLKVWKRGIDLTERIYDLTSSFPAEEKFGLVDQLRRAVVSIPSNIAEGWARNSPGAFGRFLKIANGSLAEIETLLVIAHRLRYISEAASDELLEKIAVERKMLLALIQSLRKRSRSLSHTSLLTVHPLPFHRNAFSSHRRAPQRGEVHLF